MKKKRQRKESSAPQTQNVSPEKGAAPAPPSEKRAAHLAPNTPGHWWWHVLAILVVLTVTFGLYHRSVGLGFFLLDDNEYVVQNPYITRFSAANVKHVLTVPYFVNYAPANLFSYMLDVAVAGGRSARAFHLSNVLWYCWVVCMVYLLAWTIRPDILTAATAALLFAVHPAHVEVTAWIASRKDLVATGFAALAMVCYLRHVSGKPGQWRWWAASLLSFIIASAAKQSVILLPAVMLAWDVFVTRRRDWRMILDKIPFGLVTVFFGWMTWHAQPGTNTSYDIVTMGAILLWDLQLLSGFGDYAMYRHSPDSYTWSWIVCLAVFAGSVLAWIVPLLFVRNQKPVCAVLAYWVLIQLIPPMVLNFVIPVTDRYLFLPSVGLCLLLPLAVRALVEKLPPGSGRAIVLILMILTCGAWGTKASQYVGEWCDARTVWYSSAPKVNNGPAYEFLGNIYRDSADRINAFLETGKTGSLTNELPLARAVLGDETRVEALRGEWTGATSSRTNSLVCITELRRLAWIEYDLAVKYRGRISTPNLFTSRGTLLAARGQFERANYEYRKALGLSMSALMSAQKRHENTVGVQRDIGIAYWNMRDYKSARDWFLKAQAEQNRSGNIAYPTLDDEVVRISRHAAGQ